MIIKSITAGNFGILKNSTLNFKEGMNIISGPNESAKSTWHAAIVAAICGLRRGRGVRKEENEFKKRFFPWNSTAWDVSAEVVTDLGEVLNVNQDLANLVSSKVLKLGKNVTTEFEIEGSPDLSTLVGLRRDIFGLTASIRQADIRLSAENAQGLQEAIQSAISSGGSGSPAASAIAALANFKQQHVGIARANAVKPLQFAIEAREAAERKLRTANDGHFDYLDQLEKVEDLERKVRSLRDAISQAEMEIKVHEIRVLQDQIDLISAEIEKFGALKPDETLESSGLDQEVAQAIAGWNTKSDIPNFPLTSSEEIAAQLLLIVDPEFNPNPNLDECRNEELRSNIRDYRRLKMELNTLSSDYAELETQSAHWAPVTTLNTGQKKSKRTFLVAFSLLSTATAIIGLVLNYLILSAVFGISALVVAYLATRTNKPKAPFEALPDDLNLKSSGNPLYGLILSSKKNEIDKKNSAIIELDDEISEKLHSLGFATNGGDFHSALSKYIFETQNSDVRKKRQEMEDLLGRAKEVENEIVVSRLRNEEILRNLRRISSICGLEDSLTANGDVLVAALKTWSGGRDSQRIKASDAKASWVMRETILQGRTLAEMQEELERQRSGIDHRLLTTYEVVSQETSIALLKRLREEESNASNIAASARGQLKALANSNISVADCEQELQEANAELERVENLAKILDKTSEFLEAAQTKVHRDVAPILEAAICAQLRTITSGRYSRAKVDPQDLSVQIDVSNGRFEDANSLSYGTTEQIYLLLRIALLDYLTSSNESCPIICDDLTVHADSERTTGILRLLKEISQKRQVIMFSQEAEVFAWGKNNLTDTCEQVMVLQT